MQTVAILPVKRFKTAKRRLEAALPSGARRALAEAMFSDVLTGLRRVTAIDEILVVSADAGAQRIAEGYGARAIDDPAELETLLGKPRTAERYAVVVADRHGTGTNALLLSPPDAIEPRYGPGSFQRHLELAQAAEVPAEVVEVASLALDVDTPDDLVALQERLAASRGGAAHTRGMLHQLQRTSAP